MPIVLMVLALHTQRGNVLEIVLNIIQESMENHLLTLLEKMLLF
jgi:hypothetical protein